MALNVKTLDGPMFSIFVESIVSQLNSGGVPNLEDTYTYICKAKCNQAKEAAFKIFETKLNELVLPCSEDTLEKAFKTAAILATDYYDREAIGEEK